MPRIMQKDFDSIVEFIKNELERRERSDFRRKHERVWKEVERQIQMEPPSTKHLSGKKDEDWHAAIQLGELADASEILAADVMRLAFPTDRTWFSPHVDMGQTVDPIEQRASDDVLRNLMAQQHFDFGLRDRVKLSVKEALHHGGFVAEVEWHKMAKFHDGSRVEELGAPAWIPYSMWDSFPDPSPQVVGTDLFYRGSMILKRSITQASFRKDPKFINKDKVLRELSEGDDVKLVIYYGNLFLPRKKKKGLFLPNRKTMISGEHIVFSGINEAPYSPIIYTGYEKDDPRDPYYTSPIVKRSPMHILATHMANKFADGIDLRTYPPIAYNNLDQRFASEGGPDIAPNAKFPTVGNADIKEITVGDPSWAREGMIMFVQSVREGTGVDSVRKGVGTNTEQTATEVVKSDQKSEIRVVDFVGTLERQGLNTFLYMQNDLNRKNLASYPFYNNEMHTPDFMRLSKSDLSRPVRFDVTGSRQLLGEEQRTARFINTMGLLAQNPMTQQQIDWPEVARQMVEDTGQKDPERFLLQGELVDPQVEQLQQQLAATQQEAQQVIGETQQKLQQETTKKLELQVEVQQGQARIAARDDEIRLLKAEKRSLDQISREKEAVEQEKREAEDLIRDAREEMKDKLSEQKDLFRENTEQKTEKGPTSQVINLNTAASKRISLQKDSAGNLTGAAVEVVDGQDSPEATEG